MKYDELWRRKFFEEKKTPFKNQNRPISSAAPSLIAFIEELFLRQPQNKGGTYLASVDC